MSFPLSPAPADRTPLASIVAQDNNANSAAITALNDFLAGLADATDGQVPVRSGATWEATDTAQDTPFVGRPVADERVVHVSPRGSDTNDGLTVESAKLTLAAALTAMGTAARGTIKMGLGVIDAGAGTSLSGYRCYLQGSGPGTIVRAATQTGPVLDFNGWIPPGLPGVARSEGAFGENAWMGDFTVEGDNTSGAAKKGINLGRQLANGVFSVTWRNITVRYTGGIPFDIGSALICTFQDIILVEPVDVVASDVPYLYGEGPVNGNRFVNVGLRSFTTGTTQNVGAGGAIVLKEDATYRPYGNLFLGCWDENLHIAEGSQMAHIRGALNRFDSWTHHDPLTVTASPTDNCMFRFQAPAISDDGGNEVRGHILGRNTGGVAYGVILEQSRNRVVGVKGHNGNNVLLAAGVQHSWVELAGQQTGAAATAVGIDDQSGNSDNSYADHTLRYFVWRAVRIEQGTRGEPGANGAMLRVRQKDGAWGGIELGDAGAMIRTGQFSQDQVVADAARWRFRSLTGARTAIDASDDGSTMRLGFHGAVPTSRPSVTGSRGGNAALASLLTALANTGLITDNTTA